MAGLEAVAFGEATSGGGVYALNGVTATVRSHIYTFTAASTFSGPAPITATDRATNAAVRTFTIVRDTAPPQVWLSAPVRATAACHCERSEATFTITWGATDAQAGVAYYDLDVSVDGGEWQRVLTRTQSTTYQQANQPANYYREHSVIPHSTLTAKTPLRERRRSGRP